MALSLRARDHRRRDIHAANLPTTGRELRAHQPGAAPNIQDLPVSFVEKLKGGFVNRGICKTGQVPDP
jgi:hypothetical protein